MRPATFAGSCALVVAAAVSPVVASDSAPTGGRAASSGTILELSVAGNNVALNVDNLVARRADRASAVLTLGRHGTDEVGKVQAQRSAGAERSDLTPGTLTLGSHLFVDVAQGSAKASLDKKSRANAEVSTSLAQLAASPGVTLGQVDQTARTFAGSSQTHSTRTVTIESIELLSLRDLVDGFGFGILSLTCEQIEDLATTLGSSAITACSMLDDVNSALVLSGTLLEGAELDATELRDATQAAIDLQQPVVDALTDTVDTLTDQQDDLLSQLDGLIRSEVEDELADALDEIAIIEPACTTLGLLCDLLAQLNAQVAEQTAQLALFDQLADVVADLAVAVSDLAIEQAVLDVLLATLAAANDVLGAISTISLGSLPSCAEAAAALTEVGGITPALSASASALASQLDGACTLLSDAIDELLDIPLLSLAGVELTLETRTANGVASSDVTGSIGSIVVGALPALGVDVPIAVSSTGLALAGEAVERAFEEIFIGLGIESFGYSITVFDVGTNKSVAKNGSSAADASLSVLSVRVPAGTASLPGTAPLGALAGTLAGATSTGGDVVTQPVSLDVGVFDVASSFPVASVVAPPPPSSPPVCKNCGELPLTGVQDMMSLASLMFASSLALSSYLKRQGSRRART